VVEPSTRSRVRLPLVSEQAQSQLARLHGAVDAMIAPLAALHGDRLQCARGCHACCIDGLTVFALEAARIVEHHAELLETGVPHPEGACAFLDPDGACRIYAQRPYVCRTQGLPLRWIEEQDEDLVELRDCCELNLQDDGTPLTELPAEQCFTLGPVEVRLREQAEQAQADARIALRSLFKS
jgi:Fe-S-cluster containining protein